MWYSVMYDIGLTYRGILYIRSSYVGQVSTSLDEDSQLKMNYR